MNNGFFRHLRVVSAVHFLLVAAVLLGGGFRGLFGRKPDMTQPMEFLVNMAPEQGPDTSPPPGFDLLKSLPKFKPIPKAEPEPKLTAKPMVEKAPDKKAGEKPEKKPDAKTDGKSDKTHGKKPIEPSKNLITRPLRGSKTSSSESPRWASSARRLSDAEIRRLLDMGATPSNRNVNPGEDIRCYSRIRDVMYDAWTQPSAADAGTAEVLAALTFRPDGTIVKRELVRRSGNSALDASVEETLASVPRISGLSAAFLEQHDVVTISFKVEPEQASPAGQE